MAALVDGSSTRNAATDVNVSRCDMPLSLRDICIATAREALKAHKIEKDQALHIKHALEAHNGGLWQVIVGQGFGASVSHDNNMLLVFRVGKAQILCFQSFDETSLVRKDGAASPVRRAAKTAQHKDDEDEDSGANEAE